MALSKSKIVGILFSTILLFSIIHANPALAENEGGGAGLPKESIPQVASEIIASVVLLGILARFGLP